MKRIETTDYAGGTQVWAGGQRDYRVEHIVRLRRRKLVRGCVYLALMSTFALVRQPGDVFHLTGFLGMTLLFFWCVTGFFRLIAHGYSTTEIHLDPALAARRAARTASLQHRVDRQRSLGL